MEICIKPALGLIVLIVGVYALRLDLHRARKERAVDIERLGKCRDRHSDLRCRSGTVLSHQCAVSIDSAGVVYKLGEILVEGREVEGGIGSDRKDLAALSRLNHDRARIAVLAVKIALDSSRAVDNVLNIVRQSLLGRHLHLQSNRIP